MSTKASPSNGDNCELATLHIGKRHITITAADGSHKRLSRSESSSLMEACNGDLKKLKDMLIAMIQRQVAREEMALVTKEELEQAEAALREYTSKDWEIDAIEMSEKYCLCKELMTDAQYEHFERLWRECVTRGIKPWDLADERNLEWPR